MAGILTLTEMSNEVLDNLTQQGAMTTANNVTLSTMAARWLNRAQTRIARMHDLIWTEQTSATVNNQQRYSFDTRLRAIQSVRLEDGTDSRRLACVMPGKLDTYYPKPNEQTTGTPTIYVPFENTNTFELFRIPDAAYVLRIRCSLWPTTLSTASQVSDYNYLDDVIIAYATMYGYQWLQEMNDSKFWRAIGDTELKAQINAEVSRFPDWVQLREGFSVGTTGGYIGEYYANPFVMNSPTAFLV